jgi:selenoprotein W-related protein
VSLVAELLVAFESEIECLTLIPSSGGRFEVRLNDKVVFSKASSGRHAKQGEVVSLIKDKLTR